MFSSVLMNYVICVMWHIILYIFFLVSTANYIISYGSHISPPFNNGISRINTRRTSNVNQKVVKSEIVLDNLIFQFFYELLIAVDSVQLHCCKYVVLPSISCYFLNSSKLYQMLNYFFYLVINCYNLLQVLSMSG